MKAIITIVLFLILGLSYQGAKAQFKDDSSLDRTTFTLLLTNMSTDGAIALQTSNYNIEDNSTIVKSMTLDLKGFNLTNTSVYSCTLTDGKWFALKNSTGSGIFSGKIKFGGTTSVLKVLSSEVLGSGFSIDGDGASGKIEIGDGLTSLTQSLSTTQCNGKVSLITVRSGATLNVSM